MKEIKLSLLRLPRGLCVGMARTRSAKEGLELMSEMQDCGIRVLGGRLAQKLLERRSAK